MLGGLADRGHDERAQVLHGAGGRERLLGAVLEHQEVTRPRGKAEHREGEREGDDERQDVFDAEARGQQNPPAKLVLEIVSIGFGAHWSLQLDGERNSTYPLSIA